MRYVGKDFPVMDPAETADLKFDFTRHPDWLKWDYIISATVAIAVVSGTDASSSTRLSGSPSWWEGWVCQTVTTLQNGVKYKLTATVVTQLGQTLGLCANVMGKS